MLTQNVEEERHKIDSRICQLRLQISELCTQRNALSMVSHLPAELMTIIFEYARDFSAIKSKAKTVMYISWVCRRWRQVAIGWPRLWSDIDFDHHNGIKHFLTRSNDIPLSLWLSLDDVVEEIFNHANRFQSFSRTPHKPTTSGRSITYLDLSKHWHQPSPNLERLTLVEARVPQTLCMTSPTLSEASFTDCLINWYLPIFPSHLTTLSITRPGQKLFVTQLLDVLTETPALTSLTLNTALQPTLDPPQLQYSVELSALSFLTIHEISTSPIHHLFGHLTIPGDTTANFAFSLDHSNDNGSRVLVSYHAARVDPPILTWLRIQRDWEIFKIDTIEEYLPHDDEIREVTMTKLITSPGGPPNPLDLPQNLDLSAIKSLELTFSQTYYEDHRKVIQPRDWRRVLGGLPDLQILKMGEDATFAFLAFLAHEGEHAKYHHAELLPPSLRPVDTSSRRVLLRRLALNPEDLEEGKEFSFKALRVLVLTFPEIEDFDEEDFAHNRIDYHHVLVNLRIRKGLGFGLKRLEYKCWPISERILADLEEVVEAVEEG